MSLEPDHDGPWVCMAHGRFVPCRKTGDHQASDDPIEVALVRGYQTGRENSWTRYLTTHGWPVESSS